MSVLLIAGSPSEHSRSAALLDAVAQRLVSPQPLNVDGSRRYRSAGQGATTSHSDRYGEEEQRGHALREQASQRQWEAGATPGLRQALIDRLRIRELSPQALLLADTTHATVKHALAQIASARAVVVATPVYKAAYSGVLKVFLDLLPQNGLQGKAVLPLATGGSPHHMLALDYALRPVLQSLGARHILPGVYASDAQLPRDEDTGGYRTTPDIDQRLDDAVQHLLHDGLRMPPSGAFAPVPFAQVRCSV